MYKPLSILSGNVRHRLDESTDTISKVPFGQLIGGVLTACIEAQSNASEVALYYTKELLFQDDPFEENIAPITFTYQEKNIEKSITLPLITVVPTPYLKLDNIDLDFNAEVSINNQDEKNLLVTIGSTEINESALQSASANSNLHINIQAHTGNAPSGIAQVLKLFGDNGIIVEDVPEDEDIPGDEDIPEVESSPEPKSDFIDGSLQLDIIRLIRKINSMGSGYNHLAALSQKIIYNRNEMNRPKNISYGSGSGSGSGHRSVADVVRSIKENSSKLAEQTKKKQKKKKKK